MSAEKRRANRIQGGSQASRYSKPNRRSEDGDKSQEEPRQRKSYPLDDQKEAQAPYKRKVENYTFEYEDAHKVVRKAPEPKIYDGDKEYPEEIISDTTINGKSIIRYFPNFLSTIEADEAFANLLVSMKWEEAYGTNRGERYQMPRLMSWYGPISYSFSGTTLSVTETFPEWIQLIHDKVMDKLQLKDSFNSVLLNLYRDNHDSVDWHSDDENLFGSTPDIASVSLGATRNFELRQNPSCPEETRELTQHITIPLIHGSLITMEKACQLDWQHRLKKEYNDRSERINLTFRRCIINKKK